MGQLDKSATVRSVLAQLNDLDDAREGYQIVARAIDELSAKGEAVPAELIAARETMALECRAESQGR